MEANEKQVKQQKKMAKLRILTAGERKGEEGREEEESGRVGECESVRVSGFGWISFGGFCKLRST